jgi:hypothetical protein
MEHAVLWKYINEAVKNVMLQSFLRYDFCNIIFKIKHKVYTASGSAHRQPPPHPHPHEKFWARTWNL